MGRRHLKVFSRTTELEELIFTWKLFRYNVDSSLYKSWTPGSGGTTIRKTIFACVYIENKTFPEPVSQFQSKLVQSILGWKELKVVQIKGQILFEGEIIAKMG
jgi:hypothetical protein